MKIEALEEKIVADMSGIIRVNYDDEKNGQEFNGQEFMTEMYKDGKRHFFVHPSTWVDVCCKGLSHDDQIEMFKRLFETAWNQFAKTVTK